MIRARALAPLVAMGVAALAFAACGDDDEPAADDTGAATTTEATAAPQLDGVKDYLLDHTEQLTGFTADFQSAAEEYHALAEEAGFDYEALWAEHGEDLAPMLEDMKSSWIEGKPVLRAHGRRRRRDSVARRVRRHPRRRLECGRGSGERGALRPRALRRHDPEAARQPLQSHRGRPLGDASGRHAAEHARGPGRQRHGGLRRGAAECAVPPRLRRGVRPLFERARRLGRGLGAERVRRVHGPRRDGPDDERVLRPVEGVALRARRRLRVAVVQVVSRLSDINDILAGLEVISTRRGTAGRVDPEQAGRPGAS